MSHDASSNDFDLLRKVEELGCRLIIYHYGFLLPIRLCMQEVVVSSLLPKQFPIRPTFSDGAII